MNRIWRPKFFSTHFSHSINNNNNKTRILLLRNHYATNTQNAVQKEGFNSAAWRNALLFVLAGFAWYHFGQYITKNGEYIETLITPESEYRRRNLEHLYFAVEQSKDNTSSTYL
nr:1425_t:CDS:2 [Entrophospora candida]